MKKKIFTTALAIALIVLSIAGSSLAYFTDVEKATNVFTAGNVDIKLTYGGETADEDSAPGALVEIQTGNVYPGMAYSSSAVITNIGSEAAYVGAIFTLSGSSLSAVIKETADADNIPAAIRDVFTISTENDVAYEAKYIFDSVNNEWSVYVVLTEKLAGSAAASATINATVAIPTAWDNAEMSKFNGATVKVTAYATQTVGAGFETAASALETAFADWAAY